MPPPRVVGLNGQVAMVESNGQTLPVAWQQVNDPQLSAMVADYQASQQMPEPEMYADNTRLMNVGNDVATDATPPPTRRALIDVMRERQALPALPAPPPLTATNDAPVANVAADVRGQFAQAARTVNNRVSTRRAPPTSEQSDGRPGAQLVVPTAAAAPQRSGARRPAQRPQQAARPMTDDEFIASVDQRRSRPGGPNSPRQAPTVADTAQREIANMRGLSDGQRELLSAQLAPLSAAEDTVRAQQQAETEQRNAVAGLGVSRMIDQEESRMRRQEREDRDRKFEETYAKERADLSADSYWKDKGIGMQVFAAISAGLGAMGAALNGGPNYALEIINGAIDRDIALKREAIGTKEDNLQRERTRFEDDEQWALAERMRGYEVAEQQIEMLGAGARTAQQRQAAVELQSQMRGLVAQTREQVRIDNARRAAAAARAQREANEPFYLVDYGNGIVGRVRQSDQAGLERNAKILGVAQPGDESAPQIPASFRPTGRGPVGQIRETDLTTLNERAAATRAVLAGTDHLMDLRRRAGTNGEHWNQALVAEIQSTRNMLKANMAKSMGTGAMDEGNDRLLNGMIPDPAAFSVYGFAGGEDPVISGLQQVRRDALTRINALAGGYNLEFNENNAATQSDAIRSLGARQGQPAGGR